MKKDIALLKKDQRLDTSTKTDFTHYPMEFQQDLRTIVAILESYNVSKVLLYGSLARGDSGKDSDIDICVEGLTEECFFVAYADCLLAAEHPISIIDLKSTHGYFRQNILNDGVVLYDRG